MYAPERSANAVAISSFATANGDAGGRIDKVLVLNGEANSGLAALLSNLEAIAALVGAPENRDLLLAPNQREALFELRKAAYGY